MLGYLTLDTNELDPTLAPLRTALLCREARAPRGGPGGTHLFEGWHSA